MSDQSNAKIEAGPEEEITGTKKLQIEEISAELGILFRFNRPFCGHFSFSWKRVY